MITPASSNALRQAWEEGVGELRNVIATMREEVLLFGEPSPPPAPNEQRIGNQIFVVHGQDQAMKEATARSLDKLGLVPIILHERPSEGRTIIEKFTDYAQVGYAVVLLSPDDLVYEQGASPENGTYRARQNVVFELGYFVGSLGRQRVLALYRQHERFEMPSDYSGVLFVPFDSAGRWQFDLVRELKAAGYDVDANRLLA
ncbi:MAG: nucleotide-binding protein [Anaerolineales bacterium]|nr:nucleotide-binding protein [Anaerolineales bacterium]